MPKARPRAQPKARIATTVRIDPDVHRRLSRLGELLGKSVNELTGAAIRDYVARRSRDVETKLESTLADLRAYRETDPDFERAIAATADAEVAHAEDDPAEGRVVADPGATRRLVRNLLK